MRCFFIPIYFYVRSLLIDRSVDGWHSNILAITRINLFPILKGLIFQRVTIKHQTSRTSYSNTLDHSNTDVYSYATDSGPFDEKPVTPEIKKLIKLTMEWISDP